MVQPVAEANPFGELLPEDSMDFIGRWTIVEILIPHTLLGHRMGRNVMVEQFLPACQHNPKLTIQKNPAQVYFLTYDSFCIPLT
jgi:hypothetical protein